MNSDCQIYAQRAKILFGWMVQTRVISRYASGIGNNDGDEDVRLMNQLGRVVIKVKPASWSMIAVENIDMDTSSGLNF